MGKLLIALSVVSFAALAQAAQPNFSVLNQGEDVGASFGGGGMHGRHGKCAKEAWTAANPTADQNTQATAEMTAAKAVYDAHKAALKTDMQSLFQAWGQHPVVKADVVTAEKALHDEAIPVFTAVQDAKINVINLLTADQRTAFNTSFMACIKANHPTPTPPTPEEN